VDTNLPIDNIKDPSRSKVTRSVDNSDQIIRGFFPSAKEVSAAVIGRHNFTIDMQYKISLYNNTSLDTIFSVTSGTEDTNDKFYIAGNNSSIFIAGVNFDVIGDTAYTHACSGGTNNTFPTKDVISVSGDKTTTYVTDFKFDYTADSTTTANKTYTVISSTFDTVDTNIIVDEEIASATFDGILHPYARYTVDTDATDNTTTYTVTGGVDNTDPTNDVFYIAGDQSAIFSRATEIQCLDDTNSTSNIVYTIVSVFYNSGDSRTEITVEDDITGHAFNGNILPKYTTIPVATNTITTPNFDGTILPDFLAWDSGILNVTSEYVGSTVWEWGAFLWGIDAWGSDKLANDYTPPANIVEWLPTVQTGIKGFRLDIYLAGGNTSYFEIGRIIIGKYIQPTYNIGYGHSLTWEENTKQYRTEAGSLRSDISIPFRKFEFNLGTITETDRVLLQHELRNVGLRKDIFISLFPEDDSLDKKTDYSGIVKMTKVPRFTEFAQNYYKAKYIMEEV